MNATGLRCSGAAGGDQLRLENSNRFCVFYLENHLTKVRIESAKGVINIKDGESRIVGYNFKPFLPQDTVHKILGNLPLSPEEEILKLRKVSYIDKRDVDCLVGDSPVVLIYGFLRAAWLEVYDGFIEAGKETWDYEIGNPSKKMFRSHIFKFPFPPASRAVNSHNETAVQMNIIDNEYKFRRLCKSVLLDIIYYNYRQSSQDASLASACALPREVVPPVDSGAKAREKAPIPIIYNLNYSIDGKLIPFAKEKERCALSELEFLRKITTDEKLPESFRQEARKSVKFVTAVQVEDLESSISLRLLEVKAPWEENLEEYIKYRTEAKSLYLGLNPHIRPQKDFGWRESLLAKLKLDELVNHLDSLIIYG